MTIKVELNLELISKILYLHMEKIINRSDQRVEDVEQAGIGANAEKQTRDFARRKSEEVSEEEKTILDQLAEKRGEEAMKKYAVEKKVEGIEKKEEKDEYAETIEKLKARYPEIDTQPLLDTLNNLGSEKRKEAYRYYDVFTGVCRLVSEILIQEGELNMKDLEELEAVFKVKIGDPRLLCGRFAERLGIMFTPRSPHRLAGKELELYKREKNSVRGVVASGSVVAVLSPAVESRGSTSEWKQKPVLVIEGW
jgi:hypothetical protein